MLLKRVILLTGDPGIGKTTALLRIVESLRSKGYTVGGMMSREVRSRGVRVGFEVLDLSSGRRGWLARVDQKSGPRLGKYRVNLEDLDSIGAGAIENAVKSSDVIAIDEIGPMELFSERFRESVIEAVQGDKLMVGVIHWRAGDRLVDQLKKREDAHVHVVTADNREGLLYIVSREAMVFLENRCQRKTA